MTKNRLGEVRKNNKGTDMKIITYRKADDIDVQFLDGYGYIKEHTMYQLFNLGQIKNPYDRQFTILAALELEIIKYGIII